MCAAKTLLANVPFVVGIFKRNRSPFEIHAPTGIAFRRGAAATIKGPEFSPGLCAAKLIFFCDPITAQVFGGPGGRMAEDEINAADRAETESGCEGVLAVDRFIFQIGFVCVGVMGGLCLQLTCP
jgi:hypothetical protein